MNQERTQLAAIFADEARLMVERSFQKTQGVALPLPEEIRASMAAQLQSIVRKMPVDAVARMLADEAGSRQAIRDMVEPGLREFAKRYSSS